MNKNFDKLFEFIVLSNIKAEDRAELVQALYAYGEECESKGRKELLDELFSEHV